MCQIPRMRRAFGSSFTLALFIIDLACLAYLSVLSVSSMLVLAGLIVANMAVFELPPKDSFSSLKNVKQNINGTHIKLTNSKKEPHQGFLNENTKYLF